jgi:hypothetical protein
MSQPSQTTRRRLRHAAEFAERFPADKQGRPRDLGSGGVDGFWAEITGAGAGTPVAYNWKMMIVDPADGSLGDDPDGVTGTGTAYEATDSAAPTGLRAWLRFAGYNAAGNPVYVFQSGGGLPEGGSQYMVLQRDAEGNAIWDWVRAH